MSDRRIDAAAEADAKRLSMLVGPAFRQLKQALMSEMRDDEAHAITLSAFDAFSRSYSAWELRTGRVGVEDGTSRAKGAQRVPPADKTGTAGSARVYVGRLVMRPFQLPQKVKDGWRAVVKAVRA